MCLIIGVVDPPSYKCTKLLQWLRVRVRVKPKVRVKVRTKIDEKLHQKILRLLIIG